MRISFRFVWIAVALLSARTLVAESHPRSPFSADISWELHSGPKNGLLHLTVTTLGRRFNFRLKQIGSPAGVEEVFYRGRNPKSNRARTGVALDIIDKKARAVFLRRGRSVVVEFELDHGQRDISGQTSLSSSFRRLGCGTVADFISSGQLKAGGLPASTGYLLELAADADFEFYTLFGTRTGAEIQAILNAASAVYLEQLNLDLRLIGLNQWESESTQPYSGTSAYTLLEQFQNYSILNQHLGQADLYHLFTGRNLQSNIVGLAYQASVCEAGDPFSYGLSAHVSDFALQAVITAHEIGHSLGAAHDNTSSSLMNSVVGASKNRFSEVSLAEIDSHLASSRTCIEDETDLELELSQIDLRRSAGFVGFQTVLRPSGGYAGCKLRVYGSLERRVLNDSRTFAEQGIVLLFSERFLPAQNLTPKILSARVRVGNGSRRSVGYIRAALSCGGGRLGSSKAREIRTFADSAGGTLEQFFRRLKRKL